MSLFQMATQLSQFYFANSPHFSSSLERLPVLNSKFLPVLAFRFLSCFIFFHSIAHYAAILCHYHTFKIAFLPDMGSSRLFAFLLKKKKCLAIFDCPFFSQQTSSLVEKTLINPTENVETSKRLLHLAT